MMNARKKTKIQRPHATWSFRIEIYVSPSRGINIHIYIYNMRLYLFYRYINDKYTFIIYIYLADDVLLIFICIYGKVIKYYLKRQQPC